MKYHTSHRWRVSGQCEFGDEPVQQKEVSLPSKNLSFYSHLSYPGRPSYIHHFAIKKLPVFCWDTWSQDNSRDTPESPASFWKCTYVTTGVNQGLLFQVKTTKKRKWGENLLCGLHNLTSWPTATASIIQSRFRGALFFAEVTTLLNYK